jgi:hypothetical protein
MNRAATKKSARRQHRMYLKYGKAPLLSFKQWVRCFPNLSHDLGFTPYEGAEGMRMARGLWG